MKRLCFTCYSATIYGGCSVDSEVDESGNCPEYANITPYIEYCDDTFDDKRKADWDNCINILCED
jgi:hypothetical protein